jgi:hypothetical protein
MLPSRVAKPPSQCAQAAGRPAPRRPRCRPSLDQIVEQLSLAVDRVMTEGSLYDPELAALAIKQARGDMIEAIFLLRAYRATLPRFGYTKPLDTAQMQVEPPRLGHLQGSARRPAARVRHSTTRTVCSILNWRKTHRLKHLISAKSRRYSCRA